MEVGPVTDDARGGGSGGDAAAPAAEPLGEGHTDARAPDLRLQLLLRPLGAAIVGAHQAGSPPPWGQ